MNIAALTSGKTTPSTRFRIRQHIDPLRDYDISISEYYPLIDKNSGVPPVIQRISNAVLSPFIETGWRTAKLACRIPGIIGSRKADATWISRELLPGYSTMESILKNPVYFDVDDAIWHAKPNGKKACKRIAECSHAVIAGNDFLADWFSQYNSNVYVVPTAIDTDKYAPKPANTPHSDKIFTIGWTGISGNFVHLYQIEDALYSFLSRYDAELLIVSEIPPAFKKLKSQWIRWIQWSPAIEASIISEMDVGLMPIPDSEWSRGKCSFKMLQYLSCGIPCIASPVGMNLEVFDKAPLGIAAADSSEFYEGLELLYQKEELRNTFGTNGRLVVENHYSRKVVTQRLASIFLPT